MCSPWLNQPRHEVGEARCVAVNSKVSRIRQPTMVCIVTNSMDFSNMKRLFEAEFNVKMAIRMRMISTSMV